MSDFSDKEDKMLIHLALREEANGKSRISWVRIAKRMRTKKRPEQLRLRVHKLKERFGTDLTKYPAWYRSEAIVRNKTQTKSTKKASFNSYNEVKGQTDNKENVDSMKKIEDDLLVALALLSDDDTMVYKKDRRTNFILPELLPGKLTTIQSHIAVSNVFAPIKKKDVRQASGKTENNAGELTPQSTSDLIKECGIGEFDVFADIGSGVGNVVAQVALETIASTVIGVEIRSDIARLGESLMKEQTSTYLALQKIKIYPQDICSIDVVNDKIFHGITVLYCHNTLFKPQVLHVLENICCRLPCLRTIVIQLAFCPRHRDGCLREFCLLFKKRPSLCSANVTFKASQVHLQIYDRVINK